MPDPDHARSLWDAEAATFDDEPDHGLGDHETRDAWRALLLSVLPPAPARIADLGCGTGTLAVLLAAEGYAVDGLDVSPEMVARARAKAAAARVPVRARVGDANAPGLDPASYDVVLSRHVLWAMDDPPDALGRWVDLLRPGGRLVLIEGSWSTGAGITRQEAAALVLGTGRHAEVLPLPEPVYWGKAITDDRYLVVSRS
ncbi:methyltransferase domain-containing protein [Nocardioides guangzhouensis]|uniref:Methyltransferase domain-containing protein n=1 Tax=Nocardioides guangzhouensis TaxID=2497878 RepID=A0A4Q4ZCI1_9ACTN|nr:methyltransferase domain-containing protein [Nocardioides guangzhouensis]RYP85016.1 methyltransferase domain-containing protein [Nocardioides guangzhouensis]